MIYEKVRKTDWYVSKKHKRTTILLILRLGHSMVENDCITSSGWKKVLTVAKQNCGQLWTNFDLNFNSIVRDVLRAMSKKYSKGKEDVKYLKFLDESRQYWRVLVDGS